MNAMNAPALFYDALQKSRVCAKFRERERIRTFIKTSKVYDCHTLPAEMFGGSDFWLEPRVIIKILKKMIPHMKPKVFFIRKKNILKKKSKMADSKKGHFSKSPIHNTF